MRSKIFLFVLSLVLVMAFPAMAANTLFSTGNTSGVIIINLGHDEIYTSPLPGPTTIHSAFLSATSEEECICTARNLYDSQLWHSKFPVCEDITDTSAKNKCINNRMWRIKHFDKVVSNGPHPNYNDLQEVYAACVVRTTGGAPGRDWTPHLRLNTNNPDWGNPNPSMFKEDGADLYCPLPARTCPIDNCATKEDCHKWYEFSGLSQAQSNAAYDVCLSRLPKG